MRCIVAVEFYSSKTAKIAVSRLPLTGQEEQVLRTAPAVFKAAKI